MADLIFNSIKSLTYQRPVIKHGYTDQFLFVDITNGIISVEPVAKKIKKTFIGGKGYDLWLLWNAVKSTTTWNDPENAICIACGPLGGTPNYPGSGKSTVTSISPLTGSVVDSNVGGHFGPLLKFAGFDALKISGKSTKDLVLFIDGPAQKVEIFKIKGLPEASHEISQVLHEHFANPKPGGISVVSTGPGAYHTLFGCLNFTWYDLKRKMARYKQAGRGGIGTVMAHKGLKAIVVRDHPVNLDSNQPVDKEMLKKVARLHSREILEVDPKLNRMSSIGTTHLVPIMNEFDLLPTHNFKFGSHPQGNNIGDEVFKHLFDPGFDGCWKGCVLACAHGVRDFVPLTGPFKGKKVFVDGPEYETIAGCGSNLGIFDPYTILEMNFYCDTYGLDTISVGTGMAFIMECYEAGLIDISQTSGLEMNFGNRLSALNLLHEMAQGKGFGVIAGQGILKMKSLFAEKFGADPKFLQDIGMESKGLEFSEYMTKESLAQQGGYGLALKGAQHDEAWLIFLDMVHKFMPTFELKAEALHWFPMFRTWFSLCGLCKLPWNDVVPPDNKNTKEPAKVIKHVQWYSQYFTAVTGIEVGPEDLITMSEAVYNFQRIFNLKMGFGTRKQDSIPYRAMGPVTKEEYLSRQDRYDKQLKENLGIEDLSGKTTKDKIAALRQYREKQYEKLKDAVYKRRGWTLEGVPTLETVKRLKIDFPEVVELLTSQAKN